MGSITECRLIRMAIIFQTIFHDESNYIRIISERTESKLLLKAGGTDGMRAAIPSVPPALPPIRFIMKVVYIRLLFYFSRSSISSTSPRPGM